MGLARNQGKQYFRAGRDHGVEADDGIPGRKLIVGQVYGAVAPEHGLEAVDGGHPSEVLDPAGGLGESPGDDHAILQFLHVTRSGHARLHEDTDRRDGIDEGARGFLQLVEPADGDAAATAAAAATTAGRGRAEGDRSGGAHGEGIPVLAGKGKREVVQAHLGFGEWRAELGVPLQSQILGAVAGAIQGEP
jgi:hypothetical protein